MMTAPRPTKTVSAAKMARLQAWNDRKPVIAIMGEFSAGKSTLLNMLIGQAILPTQITATKLPPVWLRHGNEAPYRVDRNNVKHPVDLNNLAGIPLKDTRYIRIYVESEVLESCDLLDTPGISDPNIPMTMWFKTLGYASAALWCTHAGQAWRESERGAWESLPDRLRRHSILLVTRADKITTEIDRMKIDNRLRRETDHLFGARLFISLVNALKALEGEGDADLWAASGAEAFVENLAGAIAAINEDRSVAIRRFRADPLERTQVAPRRIRPGEGGIAPAAAATAAAVAPAAVSGGADVVPLRPRVVATNPAPASAHPAAADNSPENALRGAFRQSEPVAAPEDDIEADFVSIEDDMLEDGEDLVAMDDDFELADVEVAEVEAQLDEPDFVEANGPEVAWSEDNVPETIDGDDEAFAALAEVAEMGREPELAEELPEMVVAELAEVDDFEADFAEEPVEEFSIDIAALEEFAETAVAAPAVEPEELSEEDRSFIEESLSLNMDYEPEQPVPAQTVEVTEAQPVDVAAPLAAALDVEEEAEDGDDFDGVEEGTATALWRDVLAGRQVNSVQELLMAFTDFVEQLDASGFKLNPPQPEAESDATLNTRQLRAQRRAARLARRMRAGG